MHVPLLSLLHAGCKREGTCTGMPAGVPQTMFPSRRKRPGAGSKLNGCAYLPDAGRGMRNSPGQSPSCALKTRTGPPATVTGPGASTEGRHVDGADRPERLLGADLDQHFTAALGRFRPFTCALRTGTCASSAARRGRTTLISPLNLNHQRAIFIAASQVAIANTLIPTAVTTAQTNAPRVTARNKEAVASCLWLAPPDRGHDY